MTLSCDERERLNSAPVTILSPAFSNLKSFIMRKGFLTLLSVIFTSYTFCQDSLWRLTGNAGTTNMYFLGTTDARPLFFRVNNSLSGWIDNGIGNNTSFGFQAGEAITTGSSHSLFGYRAGRSLTTGQRNTAIGHSALYTSTSGSFNTATGYAALYSNSVGAYNTAGGIYALYTNTTGANNTASGANSLRSNTIGVENTATGFQALYANSTGNYNTALGVNTLYSNTTGYNNVAVGHRAMFLNTNGVNNTAVGLAAMHRNVGGYHNVAMGFQAMYRNQSGHHLVAIGASALYQNTEGGYCIAIGDSALYNNTTGISNTAVGTWALVNNTRGSDNTAIGSVALHNNTTGWGNVAYGESALHNNTTGHFNTAIGTEALYGGNPYTIYTGYLNTAVGFQALAFGGTGNDNVAVGQSSAAHAADHVVGNTCVGAWSRISGFLDTCINSTALGRRAMVTASDQVRVGNSSIISIGGFQDWTNISDNRFKKNIQQNVPGLDFILQLKPVTYNLDVSGLNDWLGVDDPPVFSTGNKIDMPQPDENAIRQKESQLITGFLAQEVEAAAKKINYNFSGVDAPKNEGDLYGLRYAQFVVPLVKAVQEQQAIIDELKKENLELKQQLQQIRIRLGMETIITKSRE
jgi:trimeric autotransporter adhesin